MIQPTEEPYLPKTSVENSLGSVGKEPELPADNFSVELIPAIITYCPPLSIQKDLHTTFMVIRATDKTNSWRRARRRVTLSCTIVRSP